MRAGARVADLDVHDVPRADAVEADAQELGAAVGPARRGVGRARELLRRRVEVRGDLGAVAVLQRRGRGRADRREQVRRGVW
jgi:hypothetical protein